MRYMDLKISIHGFYYNNQSVVVNRVLGLCGAYTLGGLSTIGGWLPDAAESL